METIAIVNGTRNLDAAKTLVDFAVSEDGVEMYFEDYSLTPRDDVSRSIIGIPDGEGGYMIEIDPAWLIENNNRIMENWNKRYAE
jgi:iron(III) transport system substrate-binding protein